MPSSRVSERSTTAGTGDAPPGAAPLGARPPRNPFPGLRPFEPDEEHLFFGREREIDDLLRRLGTRRFVPVVGTSGCGKSSLIRSGLIPELHSGSLISAGSGWRVAVLRPGEDPIGHLAEALGAPNVIGTTSEELTSAALIVLEASLRRGTLSLVDAIRHARIPRDDNVLIVVDQFEELFRFQRSRHIDDARDEAVAFVKLLLEAVRQDAVPIYVVLTMRSDFLGDCMAYPGLPEAINDSLYLVPRMTRDELRSAITGPVAVAGGKTARRLVLRLLNDVGDDQDQLPLMQHVLMRTWDHWTSHRTAGAPMDLTDYEAVGTLHHALSMHAEEAYEETGSDERKRTTELIFKALTDTFTDPRGVRRPTAVAELAAICAVDERQVIEIVEIFRRPGRSFLMPPATVPLTSRSIVDLSHESLMRCWTRLIEWAREERASAALYVRLSREASWFHAGEAGLWGDPELELGLRWRSKNQPTAAWARRLDESEEAFPRAIDYLERSAAERDRMRAERRAQRIRNLRIAWGSAGVLLVMLVIAVFTASVALRERARAERNFGFAKQAVDETLLAIERDPAMSGADLPLVMAVRRELLERAKRFYVQFLAQKPTSEELAKELGVTHSRLGDIHRGLDQPDTAIGQYRQAIQLFDSLAGAYPSKPEYRQRVANSWNWLGETVRPLAERSPTAELRTEAQQAYDNALRLQQELVTAHPRDSTYKQEMARTYYNRGILYGNGANPGDTAFARADDDFRKAIALLEPIAGPSAARPIRQDLARVYNNRAGLLARDSRHGGEALALFERAVHLHQDLVRQEPQNREYKVELASFLENLATEARDQHNVAEAADANDEAIAIIEDLVRPGPSIAIEQADAHGVRASILQQARKTGEAVGEYRRSLELFRKLGSAQQDTSHSLDYHRRVGDLLEQLASMTREFPSDGAARSLLSEGVGFYAELWRQAVASGRAADARSVVDNQHDVLDALSERDRQDLMRPHPDLQQAIDRRPSGSS
jgi:tetratricopeptide (TPR) repeat protein